MEDSKFKVEKFNRQNFQLWKMQVEDSLYKKDLWKPLEGKTKRQGAIIDEDWEILDRKALGSIQLCLAPSVTFKISQEKMTVDLMYTLAKLYEKPSTLNMVFLMKHLFNMKMGEGGSVASHLNNFNTITNQLTSVQIIFDHEIRALSLLFSLPESWNSLVMAVSNSVLNSNTLKLDEVVGVVLSEEMRRKSTNETSTLGFTLNVEKKGRTKEKGKGSWGKSKNGAFPI